MKHIFTLFTILISASLFSQIEQNINKNSGTISNPIQEIDSIRFNGSLTEMEIILNNGNVETHLINDIQNVTFSGNLLGEIAELNCNQATNAGTLTQGQQASGVSSTVSYSGGNGGTYDGQTVNSTGVNGLTAALEAGVFANGNGTLLFTITGTPESSGEASFVISIGGQNCTLTRTVVLPEGVIAIINCGTATNAGTLIQGQQASGVSSTVSYTGGNGGTYSGHTVNSTGVNGLTATLEAGVFANGNGTLIFTITGIPESSGEASFAISIGGQNCTLTRTVILPEGVIASINCGTATNAGTLTQGQQASGVSSTVSYTGGNGGTYSGQALNSTGVNGLTATLEAGVFANGNGTLLFTITGTPESSGNASFIIFIGGEICELNLNVISSLIAQYPVGSVFCASGPTEIVEVTNPTTGKIWMDRNLGASQLPTSLLDEDAAGDLYQWGRRSDGHQCRNSGTTTVLSTTDQPSHGLFILTSTSPRDWRNPQNNNLWQGVNGINNPCPSGFRLPTPTETNAERLSWSENNFIGSYNSVLKLQPAGGRLEANGSNSVGGAGSYWTDAVNGTNAVMLTMSFSSASNQDTARRATGGSVRCIKN